MWATFNGHNEIARMLIDLEADVNSKNKVIVYLSHEQSSRFVILLTSVGWKDSSNDGGECGQHRDRPCAHQCWGRY
jgi:hypothetical protein